jgi:NAD-dependent SIR2 family protein deacetylase
MIRAVPDELACAAERIRKADGLLVTAGAGMGVDSGLPDFRSPEGFWRAYPALGRARLNFRDIACPETFVRDPRLAWGFYGHRLNLYRRAKPHEGFHILRRWAAAKPHGAFIYTSNVDGQFQRVEFAGKRIVEIHGSIHHLQCLDGCMGDIWSADGFAPEIDEEQCRLTSETPRCPHCRGIARPNILMFGDWQWLEYRERVQSETLSQWLMSVQRPVVIEIGAGTNIPTVRRFSEARPAALIRINRAESEVPQLGIGLQLSALDALRRLEKLVG